MPRARMSGALAIALLLSTAVSLAQTPAPAPAPEPPSADGVVETVTVEAQRHRELLEQRIATFVASIVERDRRDSLARWQVPICPLVAGLPFDKGKFVFERVSQVARDAGAPLAGDECAPNLLIVVTRDPVALIERWWRQQPRLFNQERGIGGIERTIRTAAPVRMFYNACSVAPLVSRTTGGRVADACNTGALGSRLVRNSVRALYSAIAVVDLRDMNGVGIGALADYVALRALAQIREDAQPGDAPTILRLFDRGGDGGTGGGGGAVTPLELSPWDRAFLASLYRVDSADATQVAGIKLQMQHELVR